MLRSPLAIVFGWLATHLVILSLLGFLVAGLLVSGMLDWPLAAGDGAPTQADMIPHSQPLPAMPAADPVAKAPSPDAPAASAKPTASPVKPKLIGGSLPVYQDPRRPPGPGETVDGFRPPGEMPPSASMSRDDYAQTARRAFWNGEFEAAEAAYMELIARFPADGDAFGELGNLYQAMGKPAQAMDAYFEAGIRLKAAGDTEKLQQIIDLFTKEEDPRLSRLTR